MCSRSALVLCLREGCDALSEVTKSLPLFRTCETRSAFSNGYAACFKILSVLNVFPVGAQALFYGSLVWKL